MSVPIEDGSSGSFPAYARTARARFDLRRAFVGEIRPNSPCAFALLESDNRPRPAISRAAKMQNQILACALCIYELIKIYDAAVGRAHKVHGQS